MMRRRYLAAVAAALSLGGCKAAGTPDSNKGDAGTTLPSLPDASPAPTCEGPYWPLDVGNTWKHQIVHPRNGIYSKTTTVESAGKVGGCGASAGKDAFKIVTIQELGGGLTRRTDGWDGREAMRVVRYRELSFQAGSSVAMVEECWDPARLRLDETPARLAPGATWSETFQDVEIRMNVPQTTTRTETWKIEGVDVPCLRRDGSALSVKGYDFKCLKLHKNNAKPDDPGKIYYFAKCVGKVIEIGRDNGQDEYLQDFTTKPWTAANPGS